MYFIFKKFKFICGLAQFAPAWGAAGVIPTLACNAAASTCFKLIPKVLFAK